MCFVHAIDSIWAYSTRLSLTLALLLVCHVHEQFNQIYASEHLYSLLCMYVCFTFVLDANNVGVDECASEFYQAVGGMRHTHAHEDIYE